MKYWKMPDNLRERVELFLKEKNKFNNLACEKTAEFLKEHLNIDIKIIGMETSGLETFYVNQEVIFIIGQNTGFKENFKIKKSSNLQIGISPRSKGKIARKYKKLHTTFNLQKFSPMNFADLLKALPIHFSVKFEKIDNELVITEHMGVFPEEIGLIECEI